MVLGSTRHWWRDGALALAAVSVGYFCLYFDEAVWQPSVDAAWLAAVVGCLLAWWRADVPALPRLRQPLWFYALYAAMLLPFAGNWRWSMAADTLSWLTGGVDLALHGPARSLLSVNGADNFGYLQMALHDTFMIAFSPTLFWHRAGQIAVAVLAAAAVYTVFARLVSPLYGILVAACTAATSVWIVYTYASYPFLDGIAAAYAIVAVGFWIRRDPQSRRAWLALGFLSGFMLFLTPNAWFMAICVYAWLGPQVIFRRWGVLNPSLAVVVAVVTGLPMLIQWSQGSGGQLFSLVENPGWTGQKVISFLREAAFIPFESSLQGAGAFGPQLPPGFRWLFVAGILLSPVISPPGGRVILAFYLVQVAILAFSQGPYVAVSVKRALMLIPMATYFTFLPFRRWLREGAPARAVVVVICAIWAGFGAYDLVARMQPGRTGYTLVDGVIEAHQRFGGAPVCLVISQTEFVAQFAPGTKVDELYGLSPRLQIVPDPADTACATTLCYSPQIDQFDLGTLGYVEIPMLNSVELRCGRRLLARERAAGE